MDDKIYCPNCGSGSGFCSKKPIPLWFNGKKIDMGYDIHYKGGSRVSCRCNNTSCSFEFYVGVKVDLMDHWSFRFDKSKHHKKPTKKEIKKRIKKTENSK